MEYTQSEPVMMISNIMLRFADTENSDAKERIMDILTAAFEEKVVAELKSE